MCGMLELYGGIVPQRIQAISISLVEHWSENKKWRSRNHGASTLVKDVPVQPDTRAAYPFEFQIPDNARLTHGTDGWRLAAIGNISRALDPRASIELQVGIHAEIRAVQAAMAELGFNRTGFHRPYLTAPPAHEARSHYRAGPLLESYLDGATLRLWVEDQNVVGTAVIHFHDSGIAERVKGLVGGSKVEVPLEMPREALLTTDGQPEVEGAKLWLANMLDDMIVLPGDVKKRLLRPAERPANEDERLLRPANNSPSIDCGKELLRPAPADQPESKDLSI